MRDISREDFLNLDENSIKYGSPTLDIVDDFVAMIVGKYVA